MKTRTKTLLAALLLLAISCKKESNSIQSSAITNESATQATLTDINEPGGYASIKIGSHVVMKRNLNVSFYRNGDRIPQVTDNAAWAALTTGAWCWYRNDSANGRIYGKLYNWYAVNDPRGLAPAGWHVPSDEEAETLISLLGGGTVAGGKMKSTGTIEAGTGLWHAPNTDATNSSGFTGLPGGYRDDFGTGGLGWEGSWWSSTEKDTNSAWIRHLDYGIGWVFRLYGEKRLGFSVRCLRD